MFRLIASLLIFLLVPHPIWAAKYQSSVVQLFYKTEEGTIKPYCSGVSVDDQKGIFVTAAHCVEDGGAFFVDGHIGKVVAFDYTYDVAAFTLDGYTVPDIEVAPKEIKPSDKVLLAGYPASADLMYQESVAFALLINQDRSSYWILQGYPPSWTSINIYAFQQEQKGVLNGASGGAIIHKGKLVGILIGQRPVIRPEDGKQIPAYAVGASYTALTSVLGLK